MQQFPLLETKLYVPPIRSGLVSRPRLVERLKEGMDRKLTVISAPAGFGKTTLVSEWVHMLRAHRHAPLQVAWLSLDEGDNDPTRFLTYVIAALQRLALMPSGRVEEIEARQVPVGYRHVRVGLIGQGALSALRSPQPPPLEVVLTSLINEITALPGRIMLVLDDYHLIEAQEVHDALTFLLEHLAPSPRGVSAPGGMHLVIATREDPQLPLARLRARGQLAELRAAELRFTPSESAEFLNQVMGLDLAAEDITALEARTEGWIAGLQLAALSMQGHQDASSLIRSFTGSHRFVLDYLTEEVLQQQPGSVQAFLLQTAVLNRLTGSLCDALTGLDNGRAILEMLERANLFIVPLDEERRWYRYHHLFADLLRQRLGQTQLEQEPTLHRRATEWYELNGFADEAIEHALQAEDFARAASLIEELAEATWQRGEHAKLRLWLDGLPVEVIHSKAYLCLFHAWFLYTKGPRDAAEQCLQAAEQVLDSSTDRASETMLPEQDLLSDADRQKLRGRAAVIRAFMASYRGDVPAIIEYARQAIEFLPKQDLTWRSTAALALGDVQGFNGDMVAAYQARLEAAEASAAAGSTVFSILAYIKVAITLRELGQLQRAVELCQQQIHFAGTSGLERGSLAGCLLAIWGEVLAELGDLEGAIDLTKRGVELAEGTGATAMLGWSYLCLTRASFSAGDTAGAESIVQKVEAAARTSSLPPWVTNEMAAWQVRLWLAQDRLEAASQWVRERGLVVAGESKPQHKFDFFSLNDHLLLARVLIAQERLDEASRLLPRLLEAAEAGGRTSKSIEILVLQALALQAGGNTTQSMTALERALTLAEPGGFIRTFVDEGPPMARLLAQLHRKGVAVDYVVQILAAFETTDDADADIRPPAPARETLARELSASSVIHGPPAPARVSSALVEPLSERELEVLQLVAEGLTNREIASRLFLSLNTVKTHTRNIYGKLNVHSRTQAIARSQELGLLPRR